MRQWLTCWQSYGYTWQAKIWSLIVRGFYLSLFSVSSPPLMKLRGGRLPLVTSYPLFIPSHRSELLCGSYSFRVKNSLSYTFPTVHICSQYTQSLIWQHIYFMTVFEGCTWLDIKLWVGGGFIHHWGCYPVVSWPLLFIWSRLRKTFMKLIIYL